MKTTTLLLIFLACASLSFAQVNTLPSSGKVGIGTTNPNEALEVKGNMSVDSTMTVKDTLIVEDDARIMNDMRVDGATELEDVIINGTTWMKGLQTLDANEFGILIAKEDGTVMKSGVGGLFPPPSDPLSICDLSGNPYSFSPYWVSQTEKLYTVCPDVFVGVGTETPRVNLDVNGGAFSRELAISTDPLNMGGARLKIGGYSEQNSTDLMVISNTSSDLFRLNNQGSLNLNGNIVLYSDNPTPFAISTSSGKLLQLNADGMLRSRKVRVDTEVWPDYVFGENYYLKPLNELEDFIKVNNHLPNIPDQETMTEEGIDLGKMNVILTEKVEELTLYLIEQNKQIEQLKLELESLKEEFSIKQ